MCIIGVFLLLCNKNGIKCIKGGGGGGGGGLYVNMHSKVTITTLNCHKHSLLINTNCCIYECGKQEWMQSFITERLSVEVEYSHYH